MEITRENFEEKLPFVEKAIKDCLFYAVDLEMTGISLPDTRSSSIEPLKERYLKNKKVAEAYLPTQFGLCTFEKDEADKSFKAQSFNFYIYPDPKSPDQAKVFSCQSNTLSFLLRNGFNFHRWIKSGVPFTSFKNYSSKKTFVKSDIALDANNAEFMTLLREKLCQFFTDPTTKALNVSTSSPLERRLVYQESEKICGKDVYVTSTKFGLAIKKKDLAPKANGKESKAETEDQGFSNLLRLLIDSKKPLVGHNCYMDLCFMLHHFANGLPSTLDEFKPEVLNLFNLVIDTKLVVSSHPLFKKLKGSSALERLIGEFEETVLQTKNFKIVLSNEEIKLDGEQTKSFHNAGYDAFCTGKVLLHMIAHIQDENQVPHDSLLNFGIDILENYHNKLFNMMSEFNTVNLGGEDAIPEVKFEKFLISGFSKGLEYQDLTALFGTCPVQVGKIYWVDDNRCWVEFSSPSSIPLCANPELNAEQKKTYFGRIPTGRIINLWNQGLLVKPTPNKAGLLSNAEIITWQDWYQSTIPKTTQSFSDEDSEEYESDDDVSDTSAQSDTNNPEELTIDEPMDDSASLPIINPLDGTVVNEPSSVALPDECMNDAPSNQVAEGSSKRLRSLDSSDLLPPSKKIQLETTE